MKKSEGFIRRIFSHTLLIGNIGAVVWLVLCYAASVTNPASVKYIALFSLTTPFALLTNFIFVCIWLFSSRKLRSLFSAIMLVFCWRMIPAVFGIHYFSENDWSKEAGSFKLMSWNVHAMGIFNTPREKEYAKGIMKLIRDESPDIVCIPEFAVSANPGKRTYPAEIIKGGDYKFYQFNMDNGFGPDIWIGTAVFSRFPVLRYKAHELSPYIYLVECDISIDHKVIRLGIVHLRSFGLSDQDKAVIEEVKQEKDTKSLVRSRSFIWKFNEAYVLRAEEAEKARAIISRSPYPVIICGDFNDLPFSYTYTTIKGDMGDAFTDKGRGFGRTYNQIIPTLRIDHIFYDRNAFKVKAFETPYSALSDHSPVMANFEIIGKAEE